MDKQCWSPLHHASYLGHTEIVRALLSKGAMVDTLNVSTQTPLVLAASRGHKECALQFAELGADVVKLSSAPKTPKQYAIDGGWGLALQDAAMPPEPPDRPFIDKIRARSIRIQWKLPEVRWSAPIDRFRLERTLPDSDDWTTVLECGAHKNLMKMEGLRPASWFQFRIVSRSWAGWSKPSIPSKPVQTLKDKPEQPGIPVLLSGFTPLPQAGSS